MIEIETLREENTLDEIERALLSGKLGSIKIGSGGYQYIGNTLLSHLVIEIYEPGFIENYTKDTVVHHKDGNRLNNIYLNLQVMKRSDHTRMHITDPRFTKTEEVRVQKISAYHSDPENAEAIEARYDKVSRSMIAYLASSDNTDVIKARSRRQSKSLSLTLQKKWLPLETFLKLFTIREYAEASKIGFDTAKYRLTVLFREGKITCEKELIDSHWCNIYRKMR